LHLSGYTYTASLVWKHGAAHPRSNIHAEVLARDTCLMGLRIKPHVSSAIYEIK
jgi:hypothetical protein